MGIFLPLLFLLIEKLKRLYYGPAAIGMKAFDDYPLSYMEELEQSLSKDPDLVLACLDYVDDSCLDESYYEPYSPPDEYSKLNQRELKGFSYEAFIQRETKSRGILFEGNPTDPTEWKRRNNKPRRTDLILKPLIWGDEYFELKFLDHFNGHVYPCWIERDWLPRADGVPDGRRMVYVTSNTYALNSHCRRLVHSRGELWSTRRFKFHLDFINAMTEYITIICKLLCSIWLRYCIDMSNTTPESRNRPLDGVTTLYSAQEQGLHMPFLRF